MDYISIGTSIFISLSKGGDTMDREETYRALQEAVRDLRVKDAAPLTRSALEQGLSPVEILSEGLLKGVDLVSIEYEEHRATMAQLLLACRAIFAGLEVLLPEIPSDTFQRAKELKASIEDDDGSDIGSGIVNAMVHTGALGESHL